MTKQARDEDGQNIPFFRFSATQAVAVGVANAQSTVLSSTTRLVRITTTTLCYVAFGANPVATAASLMLIPNFPEYFIVLPGEKIGVIRDTADGKLNIGEVI